MNNESLESVEKIAALEYLKSGNQTKITEQIEKIASGLEGGFEEKINQIFDIVKILPYKTENKNGVFRKRTAGQIITDGYVTGCTDEALVFIAVARAAKIPAKYIETIDDEWLKTGGDTIGGHIYAGVFDGEKWRIINPSTKEINVDIQDDGRTVFKEGLDSWDIGIDSFDSLRTQFNRFRETK